MGKRLLYARSAQWAALAERIDQLMAGPFFRPLKNQGRTAAGFLEGPGAARAFVKRVSVESWLSRLAYAVRPSRAARALRGAALLAGAGFSASRPLAALEVRRRGLLRESYWLAEPLTGARVLSRVALDGRLELAARRRLLELVAREVRSLHDRGLYSCDLQETNLLVESDARGAFRLHFVDLEDFRAAATVGQRRRLLNLAHLDCTIGRFLNRGARLRFLYAYLGTRPPRARRRRLLRQLERIRLRVQKRAGWRRLRRLLKGALGRLGPASLPAGALKAKRSQP